MTQTKMAKLAADLERAEARMLRALTKWAKLRAQVKRAGAKLDKGLGAKYDVRDLADSAGIVAKPWPK